MNVLKRNGGRFDSYGVGYNRLPNGILIGEDKSFLYFTI